MPWLTNVFTSLSSFVSIIVILYPLKIESIEISNFHVPKVAYEGDSFFITCQYKLRGSNLYSHKWYKDGLEFWRYEPRSRPSQLFLQVPDVKLSRSKSNRTHLLLTDLTVNSTGQFTCELSSDPDYHTTYRDAQLQVLPRPAAASSSSLNSSSLTYLFPALTVMIDSLIVSIKFVIHNHLAQ